MKSFETVKFKATKYQMSKLRRFQKRLDKETGSILGQVFLKPTMINNIEPRSIGMIHFSFIPEKQTEIINEAIVKAKNFEA